MHPSISYVLFLHPSPQALHSDSEQLHSVLCLISLHDVSGVYYLMHSHSFTSQSHAYVLHPHPRSQQSMLVKQQSQSPQTSHLLGATLVSSPFAGSCTCFPVVTFCAPANGPVDYAGTGSYLATTLAAALPLAEGLGGTAVPGPGVVPATVLLAYNIAGSD